MATQKPSIPKGTRDFSPVEMARRTYIFDTVKDVFRIYGFLPLETPAMENLSTLMGKYGEEGDKLLFRILNSGDFTSGISPAELSNSNLLASKICEKGLRYDLTVPFARYVVQHQNDIAFPFRRYQIQPVWRADRPQKGRYREFYQCDVDIVGSRSLANEAELVQIVGEVFGRLGIRTLLKLNNRKILAGIAETIGHADKMTDITVAMDKLDKIGMDAVRGELRERGIDDAAIARLEPILALEGTNDQKLKQLANSLSRSETGMTGIAETSEILARARTVGAEVDIELDLSLARGLNYYTGAIIEVKATEFEIGSICGGGRYDDLTGIFGMPGVSGVGISFGADRIYDVMLGSGLFPGDSLLSTRAIFLNFGGEEEVYAFRLLSGLRENGIASEIYPDNVKIKKQMEYAGRRGIPYVIMTGSQELATRTATVKDMRSGEQRTVPAEEIGRIVS